MARMTGSLVISGRDGWEWESAPDGGEEPVATGKEKRETGHVAGPRPYASPFPFPVSRASYESIDERAKEDHNAHDAVRGEERRVQVRQVPRLHQPVLPRDDPGPDRDPAVVGRPETRPRAERHQGDQGQPVQDLRERDASPLPEPHHRGVQALGPVERL